ncbi:MAG TPA: putative porin, partial [Flavisolibacter sp.]|nr:putative porin [Flavisolibacter sp.]
AFEGNFFRNLFLSTGLDIRYHTPYKQDHYFPLIGQFAYQDTTTIRNRPDIHAFFNFRIRSFQAYVRAENLNTLDYNNDFTFTRHNFAAPDYPYPGLVIRLGIFWSFVN